MKRFVMLEKRIGQTPLAAVLEWKLQNPSYADVPASYAGRLDPMASGKLLILLGDECKRQKSYTGLDKEYEMEVLLDIGSDTGDVLGVTECAEQREERDAASHRSALRPETGPHIRPYPAFSSKTVGGKPLFLHSLEGTLSTIDMPTHIEHIYRIGLLKTYRLSSRELEARITELLSLVPRTTEPSKRLGKDFRIQKVREHWQLIFTAFPDTSFTVLRLRVTCASGTYMRSLAPRIGASLHTKALALSIRRTKIGTYVPLWGTGFWLRTY